MNISNKKRASENILNAKEPEQSTDESTEDDEEDIMDADELHKSSVEVTSKDETDDYDLLYPSGLVGNGSEKREYGDEMETAGESNETLMEEDSQENSKELVEDVELEGHAEIGQIDEKNGLILPTGQWYAPSAVINDAWYCMVLHGIEWY